jgi:hypothetical protein
LKKRNIGAWRRLRARSASWAALDLVARARRLSTAPFHDAVKSFEVRTSFAILEEAAGFERGNLFGHGHGNELVDAGSLFFADSLHGVFQRPWQA